MDKSLPEDLKQSIFEMEKEWEKKDRGEEDYRFEGAWYNLANDLNVAELSKQISSEEAWYLREKYLGIIKDEVEL